MFKIGTDAHVIDKEDVEYYGWYGAIAEIDEHATEGDCYGVAFPDATKVVFFRASEIQEVDMEQERRAWDADMKDMEQIRREWRAYRDEGLGERG